MATKVKIKTNITVAGVEEVNKLFDKVSDITQKQINRSARAGAKKVQEKARQKCPVSEDGNHGRPRGFLRKNIKLKADKGRHKGKKVYSIGIGGDAYYGVMVEYGHKGKNGGHVPAKPFLRPAMDEQRDEVQKAILTDLSAAVGMVK